MVSEYYATAFRRFLIILYKGLLLRKRHYITTAFEIILPVLFASIPAIIKSETGFGSDTSERAWINDTYYPATDPLIRPYSWYNTEFFFVYAPSNDNTNKLMKKSVDLWKAKNENMKVDIKALNNSDELENYCLNLKRQDTSLTVVGTLFNNFHSSSGKNLPPNLNFTIRYAGDTFSTKKKYQFSNKYGAYSHNCFLSWQAAVERAFIELKMVEHNNSFDYEVWNREFPYPAHKDMGSGFDFTFLIQLVITCGFLVFAINLIKRIIEEKSNGSKELLKMMGMTDFIYWFSTFLNYFIFGALICLIITIVYKSPLKKSTVLLHHSDFLLVFLFFTLFIASLILFCFALTTFFNKTIYGIVVMLIIYIVSYAVLLTYIFIPSTDDLYDSLSLLVKFSICLLPTGALLTMCHILTIYETAGEGVLWSNLYSYDAIYDINISFVMLSTLFSCFLYILIIWYIDAVWPWQYGNPKPFYFPFTKSYWCGYHEKKEDKILLGSEDEIKHSDFFEDEPTGTSPGVVIHNLSKVFRNGLENKVAVNNVSLNIYNGQITALLGHNGAGKTTTINILTGLFSPSCGTASINGWDIFCQTSKARQSIGVCPQHDMLYDTLTVGEHLKIYAALKGVSWNKLDKETNSVITMLSLTGKKNELAKNLSGGAKRKLSLGIAFIGGSKVLFLDEPTSGMDVEARRKVWDTLLDVRHSRTIILTTHYMEEADILGDRIAIMADGEIQCCGSPLFLKKKFGTGYHLHLVKRENFDLSAVTHVLEKFIPSAVLENDYEGEVSFNLTSNAHSNFGELFEELESQKDALGVNSCGITVTTMEDVFLNVANISNMKFKTQEEFSLENAEEIEMKDIYVESNEFGRSRTFVTQFLGLFLKRVHYAKRHWHVLIPQLILPFIIMCLCMSGISVSSYQGNVSEPPLKLDIREIYGKTDGFYHSDNKHSSELIATEIEKVLQENNVNVKVTENPEEFVLNYARESMSNYYKQSIVGGDVKSPENILNLTAWYNGYPVHAQPLSLLLMDTAILRRVTKSGYITLTNNPLPQVNRYFYEDSYHLNERFLAMGLVPLALSFLSASFVLVPIHERATKAKLLQMMTGISSVTYWLSMFIWDFLINIIVTLFLIIPFAIFSKYAFFSPHSEAIGTVILLVILYGWSSIPLSYLISLLFKKPNTGFAFVIGVSVVTGIAVCTIFQSLTLSEAVVLNSTGKAFSWILKIFPSYALSSGFSNLFAISYSNAYCDTLTPNDLKYNCEMSYRTRVILKCCKDLCGDNCLNKTYPITMDKNACGRDILLLFLDGILYFSILLLLESTFTKMFFRHCSQRLPTFFRTTVNQFTFRNFVEDSDVLQEEERIRNNYSQSSHDDALVVLNLSKKFKHITAVDRLTFGIHKTECFGLLGVNGAGKTTTFRMLAGDCYPTEGNAFIGNYSVIKHLEKFQSYIGYCPQFDPLIDRLSAREMITLFARLRGFSGPSMTRYVNALIKMTDLSQYADKPSMVYSGGNKRKLSIAIALIGAPPLLLLDEPTAGVDPVSRRKIWKILSLARIHSGAAVILTTHSMEESEALCSRLAIMVNGRFRCLGSIQHLKSKFGQGYTLIIKLKREEQSATQSVNAVKSFIETKLPGANLKDDHQGMLQYHVVDPSVTLSYLFRFMDNMKQAYNLEDYVISDTSLEQIFLTFARSQIVIAS